MTRPGDLGVQFGPCETEERRTKKRGKGGGAKKTGDKEKRDKKEQKRKGRKKNCTCHFKVCVLFFITNARQWTDAVRRKTKKKLGHTSLFAHVQ